MASHNYVKNVHLLALGYHVATHKWLINLLIHVNFLFFGWITSNLTWHMFKFLFFFFFKSWSNGMTTKRYYPFMTLILGNDVTYKVIRFHFFVYFLFYHIELEFSCILIFDLNLKVSFKSVWWVFGVQNWGKIGGFWPRVWRHKGQNLGMN